MTVVNACCHSIAVEQCDVTELCPVGNETDDRIPNKLQRRFKNKLVRLEERGFVAWFMFQMILYDPRMVKVITVSKDAF